MPDKTSKAFVFTINGASEWFDTVSPGPSSDSGTEVPLLSCPGADSLLDVIRGSPGVRYACFQFEVAPTTLRRHCQGYIYFRTPCRSPAVKKLLRAWNGCEAHIDHARGTPDQNLAYCSKEESRILGTFRSFGEIPSKGRRNDLREIATMIGEGTNLRDVASSFPTDFIRYSRGIQEYQRQILSRPRSIGQEVTVYWWFGPTGTGKSRTAFERYPDSYVKMPTNKWWDGYVAQETVIMDDYRPAMCPFSELLRILDRYPMKVEMKGSSVDLAATTFVITTCQRPEVLWHGKTEEQIGQLLRRITEIVEFQPDGTTLLLKSSSICYVPLEPQDIMILATPPPPEMISIAKAMPSGLRAPAKG